MSGASGVVYAAIGDDGVDPVVYGLGKTVEAARLDASEWVEKVPVDALIIRAISAEEAAAVEAGDVRGPADHALDRFPATQRERDQLGWR